MSAWGKVNGLKEGDKTLFMSDTKTNFSKNHGWSAGPDRNGRWAIVIEKDGTVSYAENESNPREVTVSIVQTVIEVMILICGRFLEQMLCSVVSRHKLCSKVYISKIDLHHRAVLQPRFVQSLRRDPTSDCVHQICTLSHDPQPSKVHEVNVSTKDWLRDGGARPQLMNNQLLQRLMNNVGCYNHQGRKQVFAFIGSFSFLHPLHHAQHNTSPCSLRPAFYGRIREHAPLCS